MIIDGVEYVRADSVSQQILGDIRIVVADRGWVFVGNCTENDDKSVTIYNAKNIRQWGTSHGLGELVNGPLAATQHDYYGTVRCTPIVQIAVNKGAWNAADK